MKKNKNIAASVRARLLERSRMTGEDFQLLLTRFGIERLLARLAKSQYSTQFTLKGAALFHVWADMPHRPTRDVDFLGQGEPTPSHLEAVFREIMETEVEPDGVIFDLNSVEADVIKEDQEYEGVRVHADAELDGARIRIQVDIGFGDAITPKPVSVSYPTLLDFDSPVLIAYPKETVIAEKFQAMIALGMANSRMKDFFDVWTLACQFEFKFNTLSGAMRNTFLRRKTEFPATTPVPFLKEFSANKKKASDWRAFLKRSKLESGMPSLTEVTELIDLFVSPIIESTSLNPRRWKPGGPWETVK